MARRSNRTYAISAGLSCGIGLAVPVVAFAATLPFEGVHQTVASGAVPFAIGALAGVGTFALAARIVERSEDAWDDVDAAPASSNAHETRRSGADDGSQRFFGRHGAPKGVPIIARAEGAPSEEEAWAEIDALLNDDSPISCDPLKSKDIYEIALEELRRGTSAPQPAAASAASEAAQTGTLRRAPGSYGAASTAAYMALAGNPLAAATSSPSQAMPIPSAAAAPFSPYAYQAAASVATGPSAAGVPHRSIPMPAEVDIDFETARRAALASLDIFEDGSSSKPATVAGRPSAQPSAAFAAGTVRGAAGVRPVGSMPAAAVQQPAARPQSEAARRVGAAVQQPAAADFSGHEDMWAQALAILADDAPARGNAAGALEGARANRMHEHVNSLIEDEFDRASSASVRHTSHEYLRVIQGGTASLPRVQEA